MNCSNCPDNCLGNEVSIYCLYDEASGKSLSSILSGLMAPASAPNDTVEITTDGITSKSLSRSRSYLCAAAVVKRDFTYSVSINQNTVFFNWDLFPVINALPAGYKLATTRVKITGFNSGGSNVITNSEKPSAGINIAASNFPITVDIVLRVNSPCGDIEIKTNFITVNPVEVGDFRAVLDVVDLNPRTGSINLTEQLNGVESQLSSQALEIKTLKELIKELRTEIEVLKSA